MQTKLAFQIRLYTQTKFNISGISLQKAQKLSNSTSGLHEKELTRHLQVLQPVCTKKKFLEEQTEKSGQ